MKIIRVDSFGEKVDAALMADSAMRPDRRPLFLPDAADGEEPQCAVRAAIRIDRLGKNIDRRFGRRYYSETALFNVMTTSGNVPGVDITDDALVCGRWTPSDAFPARISDGNSDESVAAAIDYDRADRIIEFFSRTATFKTGDVIILPETFFSYTPQIGRRIKITGEPSGETLLEFPIR